MIPFDTLAAAWRQERARRLARQSLRPRLGPEGLSLGPMVVVAKGTLDRWGSPALAIDGNEARILALLSVAYRRPVDTGAIDALRRASKALAGRNPALAPILMAQAGLGPLDADERVAFRLFAAERLLDAGLAPRALMKGLGLDPRPLDALKACNPAEPRDEHGRWTDSTHSVSKPNGKQIQFADSGQFSSDARPAVSHDDLVTRDGKPVIDPNTGSPYPRPPGMSVSENVARGAAIASLATVPIDGDSVIGGFDGVPVDARAQAMVDWFAYGPMDYQRPNGANGPFLPGYRNVSNYNFGAVAAAAGYTLEETLRAAGLYNRNFGAPKPTDTEYGIQPDAVRSITQGWSDTIAGKW